MGSKSFKLPSGTTLRLEQGDITEYEGDAIVNAANEAMLGGGGVDGAIHSAAGSKLKALCKEYPAPGGVRCPTGHARITEACELPATWVVHTVGPMFNGQEASEPLLRLAYESCLSLANNKAFSISSIAFPALSCGVYGYPLADAAKVSLAACARHSGALKEVTFMLYGEEAMQAYCEAADGTLDSVKPVVASGGDVVKGTHGAAAMQDGTGAQHGGDVAGYEDGKGQTMAAEPDNVAEPKAQGVDKAEFTDAVAGDPAAGVAATGGEAAKPVLP